MRRLRSVCCLGMFLLGLSFLAHSAIAAEPKTKPIRFNRDIRPILTKKCFKCHGPGAHNAQTDLRFDSRQAAFQDLGGYRAVVPGQPQKSELYKRITAEGEKQMPPPSSGKKLTQEEIRLLKAWIAQGAEWQKQWALQKPHRPEPPEVGDSAFVRNPIDRFVLNRLKNNDLQPSPPAEKRTLIRRLSLDLTGLPPTPGEVQAFLNDDSPDAYEQLVDRLLASPRYGEHWARFWLDGARYADTHGMHFDNKRSIWPYRDWVIEAFNDNMPFDRFTIEQLAGDLLPDPSREQLVATGFNRCNITSNEGGSIREELRVRYMIDRTTTMGTVWMGLTIGCCQCHNHKYDPIKQKEFYQLTSFFNSTADKAMDGNALLPPPSIKLPGPQQKRQLQEYDRQIAELNKEIQQKVANVDYEPPEQKATEQPEGRRDYVWIEDSLPSGAQPQVTGGQPGQWQFVSGEEHPVFSGTKSTFRTVAGRGQHYFTGAQPGLRLGKGDTLFAHVYLDPDNPPQELMLQFNDGSWSHRAIWGEDLIEWGQAGTASRRRIGDLPPVGEWVRLEVDIAEVGLKPGSTVQGWAFTQYGGTVHWDKAGLATKTPQENAQFRSLLAWEKAQKSQNGSSLPEPLKKILKKKRDKRSEQEQKRLRDYFIEHVYAKTRPIFKPLHQQLDKLKKQKEQLQQTIPATMITRNREKRRQGHVLIRGEYDQKGEPVDPGVPSVLPPLPEDAPRNRLGLAKWLVSRKHPLTSRVTVNRFWQEFFGRGLVKTAENFGALGAKPSHRQLLDWLAMEFVDSGWDIKHIHRLIATSATYRQSSRMTPELKKRDPNNRLLARGPSFRLDAETIRDYALFVSGLLVEQIGGEPVKPYQPAGLWKAVAYEGSNTMNFKRDTGKKLYRRSVYTFWKRTAPPPNMTLFDAPNREACMVRRERTNTPLQALVLMNDVQFVEAARHLAARILEEGGSTTADRIDYGFRVVLARPPDAEEMKWMQELHQRQHKRFRQDPEAARKLVRTGASPPDPALPPEKLATWTVVGNTLLNLSETITKE